MSEVNARKVSFNATGNSYYAIGTTGDKIWTIVKDAYIGEWNSSGIYMLQNITVDSSTTGTKGFVATATAGYNAWYSFQTDFSTRWLIAKNAVPESGANTGSNFDIWRYSDAGVYIDTPFSINRATGVVSDNKGALRAIPLNSQTEYTLTISDVGKVISATGNVTVPNAVFSSGDVISIYNNNTVSRNITNAGAVTMRIAGQSDSNTRVLAQYGIATILCVAANTFVISGAGLT